MIKVREIEDKDLFPLAEFLPNGFPSQKKEFWPPLFELWWTLNPAYTSDIPRGWILEKDKSIVGFVGNIPVKFLVGGVARIAAASNSWYVDPSVRGIFSFILFNQYLKQTSPSLFLFKGEEDKHIMNILSRYKFEEHILPTFQKEYVFILDKKKVKTILKTFILNNKMPKFSRLWEYTKRTGLLLGAYVFQKPIISVNNSLKETYISSVCTSCDDTFVKIWEKAQNPCDVSLSRDAKTLNWLYFSSARTYKRVVIQCHRVDDKTLAGYMVFDLIQKKPSDTGRMQLVDMCIKDNDHQVLASLTSFAVQQGKQHNAAVLIIWANSPKTETYFQSKITLRRILRHYRYVRFSATSDIKPDRYNSGNVCLPMIYPPQ
jgi:hypothetical protein